MVKLKVHVLCNVYNSRMFLSAMLETVKDHVDSVIVADGAYRLYYENLKKYRSSVKPWSTDGSIDIIRCFTGIPDLKILHPPDGEPWLNQNVKRNALVDAVPVDDWFIVLDGDEMLMGDIAEGLEDIYESGCVVASTPLYNVGLAVARYTPFWHSRIHLKMEGMHYYGTHWHLRDSHERIIEAVYPIKWTKRFVLVHFKFLKTPEQLIPHQDYMKIVGSHGWLEPELSETWAENVLKKEA